MDGMPQFPLLFMVTAEILSTQCCPFFCTCVGSYLGCSQQGLSYLPTDLNKNIKFLDASGNAISSMESGISHMNSLVTLDLKNNSLSSISRNSLTGLDSLISLNVAWNNIITLSPLAFDPIPSIKVINLEGNKLKILPEGLFANTPFLEALDLSQNKLTSSSLRVINMPTLRKLTSLRLDENALQYIPYSVLNNLYNLKELSLKGCGIKTLDANAFAGLMSLDTLDISTNDLTSLHREVFQGVYQITKLGISSNPLVCDCCVKQVQDLINEYSVMVLNPAYCSQMVANTEVQKDIISDSLSSLCSNKDGQQCDNVVSAPKREEESCNRLGIIICCVFIVLLLAILICVIIIYNTNLCAAGIPAFPTKKSDIPDLPPRNNLNNNEDKQLSPLKYKTQNMDIENPYDEAIYEPPK